MIVYDGIVFNIQRTGGISIMFAELINRLPAGSYELVGFRDAPPPALTDAAWQPRAPRFLERYRRAAMGRSGDVFHSTYYRLPAARGPRVVTSVYDFNYERFATLPDRLVHSAQKRAAIAGADRAICISKNTQDDLLEFFGADLHRKSVVVPLAASDAFHRLSNETLRPQVLFVGKRNATKNFAPVVDALAALPDLSLVCVGGGEFTSAERARLERTLPGRYHHTGHLDDAALNREYNRSLCLAYPSLAEGFGIPILEAMKAGCPVVAVRAASIPEVAGDAGILLQRGDADELRAAISSLLVAEARDAQVRRGLERSRAFSWDETCRRVRAVYEELLGHALR